MIRKKTYNKKFKELIGFHINTIRSIRRDYSKLTLNAINIISKLDIKDKLGNITEDGYTFVKTILIAKRKGINISESIEILGVDNWVNLNNIWNELKLLEVREKAIISKCVTEAK